MDAQINPEAPSQNQWFLFAFLILILQWSAFPMWNPPQGFDAQSYLSMAANLEKARETVPPYHWQRPLPSLAAKTVASLFLAPPEAFPEDSQRPLKMGFYLLSHLSFFCFSLLLLFFLSKKIGDFSLAAAFSFVILLISWSVTYPLNNIYQLCDLWTYLFTLLLLQTMDEKKHTAFLAVGTLSLFTRQNLAILVLLGNIYFWFSGGKQSWRWWAGILIHISSILLLFTLSPMTKTMETLIVWPSLDEGRPLKSLYYLTAPFVPVYILHWRKFWEWAKKFFPFTLFGLLTLYQPYANWKFTGQINLERIIMQGAWLWILGGAVLLGRLTLKTRSKILKGLVVLSPLLIGTYHLRHQMGFILRPFFFFPTHFRDHLVSLYFMVTLLAVLILRKKGTAVAA